MTYLPFPSSSANETLLNTLSDELKLKPYQIQKALELMRFGLPPLATIQTLSYLLGVSDGILYQMAKYPERYYRIYHIQKKSGGERQIESPKIILKVVQRWIYYNILIKVNLSESVNGFIPGKNIFTNAKAHTNSKNLMVIDIHNFFPSITKRRVFYIFKKLGFTVRVAYLLSGLCTFDGRLPQGAPTSPMLANLAFASSDTHLKDIAERWGCVYSRYADDLAFSGDRHFNNKDIHLISEILGDNGFQINNSKSRMLALPLCDRIQSNFDVRVHSLI
jgi:retron-type reverse transcriptase